MWKVSTFLFIVLTITMFAIKNTFIWLYTITLYTGILNLLTATGMPSLLPRWGIQHECRYKWFIIESFGRNRQFVISSKRFCTKMRLNRFLKERYHFNWKILKARELCTLNDSTVIGKLRSFLHYKNAAVISLRSRFVTNLLSVEY